MTRRAGGACAFAIVAAVGCAPDAPRTEAAASPPPVAEPRADEPAFAASAAPPASAQPAPAPVDARGSIELAPSQGDLMPLLELQVARAKERGLTPYVEFYARWCPPCKALKRYAEHPLIVDAFQGTFIIYLDADDWGDKVRGTGFVSKTIPIFFALDAKGKPTGRKLNGDQWGKVSTPEAMAPVLKAFFHEKP